MRAVANRNCRPLGGKLVLPFPPTHLNNGEVELVERVSCMCARLWPSEASRVTIFARPDATLRYSLRFKIKASESCSLATRSIQGGEDPVLGAVIASTQAV